MSTFRIGGEKMRSQLYKLFIGLLFSIFLVSCSTDQTTAPIEIEPEIPAEDSVTPEKQKLTVMTHDSFDISEDLLTSFENQENIEVQFLKAGDTGTAVNKAILSKDVPLADVFYGVDNTFLSRALSEDIFVPYESPLLIEIPDEFKVDSQNRALPVDFGDVCLNYDIAYFEESGIDPPTNLPDLLNQEYKDLLVVQNPATSSPGLAFLFSTIGHFGEDGYLEFWQGLVENNVRVVDDWETAYYSEFSRWGGRYPIVVSYGSSPPFEMIYAEEPMKQPPTAAVVSDGACFRQIEFVGILKGSKNRELAEKWIDFMLSKDFQEDIPLKMYVFPVNEDAELDETFLNYLAVPEKPVYLDPEVIALNRENWLQAWTEIVLR
jgi:thiamine transport system substrate-binding protein